MTSPLARWLQARRATGGWVPLAVSSSDIAHGPRMCRRVSLRTATPAAAAELDVAQAPGYASASGYGHGLGGVAVFVAGHRGDDDELIEVEVAAVGLVRPPGEVGDGVDARSEVGHNR